MKEVATPSKVQATLETKRLLPRALVAGAAAMRAAGRTYLPQFPAEMAEDYEARKASSVLLPAYRDAIDLACGLIFRKEVEEGPDVPEEVKPWLEDIDRTGRNITQFAESVFRDSFEGVSYIVADYPRVPAGATLAQERELGARPYLIHVKACQVLGWRTQQVNGQTVLTQFRYKECTTEPDGPFGEKDVERIRVLEPGMVSVYVKVKDDWILDPEQSGSVTLKEVAVVASYTGRTGFMTGEPPLADLAEKNAQHWRCDSDLQNVIHKTCVPIMCVIGAEAPAEGTVVAPSTRLDLPQGGDAKWIELQGSSIPTAQANIETLKDEMRAMAGKILDKGIVKTATEAGIESTQAMSRIQAWAMGLNAALNQAWALCGKWAKQELGTLAVNTDVDPSRPDAQFLTEVRNACAAGLLSKETYLHILQTAEVLPDGFDLEDELDRLEREAPVMTVTPPTTINKEA